MNKNHSPRREFLKTGGAIIAAIPLAAVSGWAGAAKNDALRTSLKYQAKPEGDKSCANCQQFVPGKVAMGPGECKILPGDNEIAPQAYCIAWAKKA